MRYTRIEQIGENEWAVTTNGVVMEDLVGKTPQEVVEKYKTLLIASAKTRHTPRQARKCRMCETWTTTWVQTICDMIPLCEDHNTPETLAELLDITPDFEMWES